LAAVAEARLCEMLVGCVSIDNTEASANLGADLYESNDANSTKLIPAGLPAVLALHLGVLLISRPNCIYTVST